jgi:hypothetical protein
VLELAVQRHQIDKARLLAFGEGHLPALPADAERADPAEEGWSLAVLRSHVRELAKRLRIPDLDLDENNEAFLAFDGKYFVKISLVAWKQLIHLLGYIGAVPDDPDGYYVDLLKRCYFWRDITGANLTVEPDRTIAVTQFLAIPFLDFTRFYSAVQAFVNAMEYWDGHLEDFLLTPPEFLKRPRVIPAALLVSNYVKDFAGVTDICRLRRGSFGPIRLAEDQTTHKMLWLESYGTMTDCTNFMDEVEIMVRLIRPCVMEIVGQSLPTPKEPARIAMKYPADGRLEAAIAEGLGDTARAIIEAAVVLGMRFVHSRGVVHRSLSPENVFLDAEGHPKIGGLSSRIWADVEATLTQDVGNVFYLAPETVDEQYRPAGDMYSFAIILYELIAKKRAFPKESPLTRLVAMVQRGIRPDIPDTVNPAVRDVITRGSAAKPVDSPSFDNILTQLTKIQFRMLPDVEWDRVASFVDSIEYSKKWTKTR